MDDKHPEIHHLETLDPAAIALSLVGNQPHVYPFGGGAIGLEEYEALYDSSGDLKAFAGPTRLFPNGSGWVILPVTVTDQNGNPVQGVQVSFRVEAVRPSGTGWRSENGVVARYGSASRPKARARIKNGQIRLIGTLSRSTATTDKNGRAEVKYTASHIGGNQSQVGEERVIASIDGSNVTFTIHLGYDWLEPIKTVSGGLRVQNATGKHAHKEIVRRLKQLGDAVAAAKWPQPVTVTAGTLRWGGLYPPHFTHQWGAEIDVRPMTKDGNPGKWTDPHYDRDRTQLLVNALKSLGASTIYFNDPKISGAKPLSGHDDHLHVSFVKGSSAGRLDLEPDATQEIGTLLAPVVASRLASEEQRG